MCQILLHRSKHSTLVVQNTSGWGEKIQTEVCDFNIPLIYCIRKIASGGINARQSNKKTMGLKTAYWFVTSEECIPAVYFAALSLALTFFIPFLLCFLAKRMFFMNLGDKVISTGPALEKKKRCLRPTLIKLLRRSRI